MGYVYLFDLHYGKTVYRAKIGLCRLSATSNRCNLRYHGPKSLFTAVE